MKHDYKTEEGFDVRLELRLKNARLVRARESLGLSLQKATERIGIGYHSLCSYENMRAYPRERTQKKICDFYRGAGIFLCQKSKLHPLGCR